MNYYKYIPKFWANLLRTFTITAYHLLEKAPIVETSQNEFFVNIVGIQLNSIIIVRIVIRFWNVRHLCVRILRDIRPTRKYHLTIFHYFEITANLLNVDQKIDVSFEMQSWKSFIRRIFTAIISKFVLTFTMDVDDPTKFHFLQNYRTFLLKSSER